MKDKETIAEVGAAESGENSVYPRCLVKETERAYGVFQCWVASGGKREPESLSGEIKAAPQTIRRWYQKHR